MVPAHVSEFTMFPATFIQSVESGKSFNRRIWLKEILIVYWKSRATLSTWGGFHLKKKKKSWYTNRFFSLSTILTSMVNTFVFNFRKRKFTSLETFFSECFYNCSELQGLSCCQSSVLTSELVLKEEWSVWLLVSDF